MKNWTGKITSLFAAGLLGLTACQKQEMDPLKADFQDRAGAAVTKYAVNISRAITASQNNRGVSRGAVGSWDPFGGTLFGGTATTSGIDQETSRCVSQMQQIPQTAQYFYLRIGTLARCLDVVVNYRNPLQTYGYRNLDYSGQQGWGYNLNYARPGSFSSFSGQDYSSWTFYAGSGFYPGQVPNYQVPGYGF